MSCAIKKYIIRFTESIGAKENMKNATRTKK
jgi:hypothetical protein